MHQGAYALNALHEYLSDVERIQVKTKNVGEWLSDISCKSDRYKQKLAAARRQLEWCAEELRHV